MPRRTSSHPKPKLFTIPTLTVKSYYVALGALFVLSTVLHFYLLRTHLHFDIDEATHTSIIWSIWHNHHLVSKGPPASGDTGLYHGAYYYYLYLIPAVISHGNPLGLAVFTIILSLISIPLLAESIREIYGKREALLVTALYIVSYYAIIYSRWIWNPNSIPFFTALSLFALSKIIKGKPRFLILFFFAIGSITQLHVGGLQFIPILLCMIPLLYRFVKGAKLWISSLVAFLIPWLPTIYHELAHNFELLRAMHKLLQSPAHISLLDHAQNGLDYFDLMFRSILQLHWPFSLIILTTAMVALASQIVTTRKKIEVLFPAYLALVLGFAFFTYSFYPGILYLHLSEQLFVLFPVLCLFFFRVLLERKETMAVAAILVIVSAVANWNLYYKDVVQGTREFETVNKICQVMRDQKLRDAEITVNNKVNPMYATYLCGEQYGITLGSSTKISFTTDFRDTFNYVVQAN